MSSADDQFDLDVRLFATDANAGPGAFHPGLFAGDEIQALADTVAPEATCPAETCGLDCQTQTCADATCGCNTVETCDHAACPGDAITFGPYCEDASGGEDTCDGCGGNPTADCADPPDVDPEP